MKIPPELMELRPCWPAVRWLRRFRGTTKLQAWRACKNHDWMLWVIGRADSMRKLRRLSQLCDNLYRQQPWVVTNNQCSVKCANLIRKHYPKPPL